MTTLRPRTLPGRGCRAGKTSDVRQTPGAAALSDSAPVVALAMIALGTLTAGQADAQPVRERPGMLMAPTPVGVLLHLAEPPTRTGGFVVYRGAPGRAPERLTSEPIRRVRDPALAAAYLGPDRALVAEALGVSDERDILRALDADPIAGDLLSLLLPRVAQVQGRVFLDSTAIAGAEYEYSVVYTDSRGRETERAVSGRLRVTESIPAAPTAIVEEAGDGTVILRWHYPPYQGDVRDLTVGFHIYRAEGETGRPERLTRVPLLRNDATSPTYRDEEAENGIAYHYLITAVDLVGREGPAARSAMVTPTDRTPPPIPANLEAEPGESLVRLTWRYIPEPDLAGYHVERSLGLSQPYTRLTESPLPPLEPFWTDETVAGGTTYFYRIVAVDRQGNESRPSNSISALPYDRTPPAPPTGVQATALERRLAIDWKPSESADVKGYYIYRGDVPERMVRLVQQPLPALAFTDSGFVGQGLNPGERYVVAVSAVDHSYNESELTFTEVTVPDDEPPAPPTGLIVENVHGRYAQIRWSSSPSLDLREYVLTRAGEDSIDTTTVEIGRAPADQPRTLRDTTLTRGQHYTYKLIAIDSAGNMSEPATAGLHFTDAVPPPAPRHAAVTHREDGAGNEIHWERVVDRDLTGYHVFRALVPTGVYQQITAEPVTGLSLIDPEGRPEHYYRVRAVDSSGNLSAPSPAVRARQ